MFKFFFLIYYALPAIIFGVLYLACALSASAKVNKNKALVALIIVIESLHTFVFVLKLISNFENYCYDGFIVSLISGYVSQLLLFVAMLCFMKKCTVLKKNPLYLYDERYSLPEDELRALKTKLDIGEITQEEYNIRRTTILKNL